MLSIDDTKERKIMATHIKTVASVHSVEATIARVEQAVTGRGMKVFACIDQAAEAELVGLRMAPAVLLLFGNPRAGTPLMIANPTVALDLPLKALAWQDTEGSVWLSYNEVGLLNERHGLPEAATAGLVGVGALLEAAAGR
ncbi:MAG TPA: DUF302 domain-containing protein [Kofleriaceae bacterium]|nr:DUF302 domain-containing protein [Kofleriaceae bacterium]